MMQQSSMLTTTQQGFPHLSGFKYLFFSNTNNLYIIMIPSNNPYSITIIFCDTVIWLQVFLLHSHIHVHATS